MRRLGPGWLAFGLGVLLIATGVGWFLATHHRVEREEDHLHWRMRRDPFRLASLLLTELGVPSHSAPGLAGLTEEESVTALLSEESGRADAAEVDRWVRWISDGHHAVLLLPEANGDDRGHPRLGLGDDAEEPEAADEDEEALLVEALFAQLPLRLETVTEEAFVSEDWQLVGSRTFDVDLDASRTLVHVPAGDEEDEPVVELLYLEGKGSARRGPVVLAELGLGEGWVTVVTSASPFRNDGLRQREHAELFWSVIYSSGLGAVRFVRDAGGAGGLWGWLRDHAAHLLVSLGALALAFVWKNGGRLGPLLPEPAHERRMLLEHVASSGHFLWRHAGAELLMSSARKAVLRRLHLATEAGAEGALDEQTLLQLAERTGRPVERVKAALVGDNFREPQAFMRTMQELQHLWRAS